MNNQETNNNEIDLEALLTKVQSLETMLLLTRTELKPTFRRYLSQFNFQLNCSK